MKRVSVVLLSVVSFSAAMRAVSFGEPNVSPKHRLTLNETSVACMRSLGIPINGDVPPELPEVLKNVKDLTNPKEAALCLKLADAISGGFDPIRAREIFASRVDISWASWSIPVDEWGTYAERDALGLYLWKLAKQSKTPDPAMAVKLAKASLVLLTLDEYRSGVSDAAYLLRDSAESKSLLMVDEKTFNALNQLVNDATRVVTKSQKEIIAGWRLIDKISRAKEEGLDAAFANAATAMDECFKSGLPNLESEHTWAYGYWMLLNHARSLKRDVWVAWLSSRISNYAVAPELSPVGQRIVKQALSRTQEPTRLHVRQVLKNGRWVEKEEP